MLAGVGGQHQWQDPIHRTCAIGWLVRWQGLQLSGDGSAVWGDVASLVKWSQRWRVGGSAIAKPMDGRPLRLKPERDWLLVQIAEKPDLTVRPVMPELAERGTPGSYGAVALLQARGHHV